MTKTYIANIKNYLFYILGGIALNLTFAAIIGGIYVFSFFIAFNTIYIFYELRTYRPRIISFDFENGVITFIHSNMFKSERIENFGVNYISFTYRKRNIPRNIKDVRNVCIIDTERKTIVVLTPDDDGWSDIQIKNIATDLVKIGTKRISEKYSDIEVPLSIDEIS